MLDEVIPWRCDVREGGMSGGTILGVDGGGDGGGVSLAETRLPHASG